jgi:hypothetical protein
MQTFTTGGRGKKQCSGCKQFVGVRTAVCPCGTSFDKKVEVEQERVVVVAQPLPAQQQQNQAEEGGNPLLGHTGIGIDPVWTPGGGTTHGSKTLVPFPPQSYSEADVRQWIIDLQEWAFKQRKRLLPQAIVYLARDLHEHKDTDAYRELKNMIRTVFTPKKAEPEPEEIVEETVDSQQ